MARAFAFAFPFVLVLALVAAGCEEDLVGRRCFIGTDAATGQETIVASPSLDCSSRTCLHVPVEEGATPPEGAQHADMCTAECSSDDDCNRIAGSPCVSGFTCAVPVVVGRFCCRHMCICRDFIVVPDGGLPEPEACKVDRPDCL